jgi:ABC-type transporter Mla subunit MlaD
MTRILVIAGLVVAAAVVVVLGTGASNGGGGDYKVRVIFDNAFSLISGEDVRVAGVNIGKIDSLEVTPDNKAAVTLSITLAGFDDFRKDARCLIRPQSLIGEKYVECTLTDPRPQGTPAPPPLDTIPKGQPGAGAHLLPVDRTSKAVDTDLINNITRLPERQRLSIIINELGGVVAGRAQDLNATIRRANPALGALNRVVKILGDQNNVLRALAVNSDTTLAPLARDRARVADFVGRANAVSRATAAKRAQLERNFQLLPRFLSELKPTMQRLGSFSDEFRPVLSDLRAAAPSVNKLIKQQGPFSQASLTAVKSLGPTLDIGRPALLKSKPIIDDLKSLTDEAAPVAKSLADIGESLRDRGGIERVMDYIFYQAAAINGYDSTGHYLRAGLIVNTCSQYATTPQPGCSARYTKSSTAAQAASLRAGNIIDLFGARARLRKVPMKKSRHTRGHRVSASGPGTLGPSDGATRLKLPKAILPGQDTTPAVQAPAVQAPAPAGSGNGAGSTAGGLLDYLLGGGP